MSKVLVVGSGGREHALAWKLAESPRVERVFVAPGNGGTARAGGKIENVAIAVNDFDRLIGFAEANRVELTVVGPEAPLVAGIADEFRSRSLPIFGPTAAGARLEGDKSHAKLLMKKLEIPTADFEAFDLNRAFTRVAALAARVK